MSRRASVAAPLLVLAGLSGLALACGREDGEAAAPLPAPASTGVGGDADASTDAPSTDAPSTAVGDAGAGDARPVGPVGCLSVVAAGHRTFPCSGITYDVEIPAPCAGGGCGVIVDVHGLTMSGDLEEKSTGLRAKAGARGFVVVQPTAASGLLGPSWAPGTDDAKVWAFLGDLRKALAIDAKRVHFTGFSQGGAMTWRMICAHADELASAAPVAAADGAALSGSFPPFALDCPFDARGKPAVEIPVLQMHGTRDGLVPFAKGVQQRDAVIAAWSLTRTTLVSTDGSHERTRYVSATGTTYEFLQHDWDVVPPLLPLLLRGHCIPGGQDQPGTGAPGQNLFFSCKPPNSVIWGDVVLQFFVDHPRP